MAKKKSQKSDRPTLSLVVYVRNEEDAFEATAEEMIEELEKIEGGYEFICINVPSIDNSYQVLEKLGDKYENFYAINMINKRADQLQKGYQLMLGFQLAKGEYVIFADSDGEVDPKDFHVILNKLEEGFDVVNGWRSGGEVSHGFMYNFTSRGQNVVTRMLTGLDIKDKNAGLKGFSNKAAKSLVLYGRNFRDILVQIQSKGYSMTEVEINWRQRAGGIQSFKFMDRLFGGTFDLVADIAIARMVDKPMRFWGVLMIISWLLSFILGGVGILNLELQWLDIAQGFSWFNLLWIGVVVFLMILGVAFFIIGIVLEFIVSQRPFDLNDYFIIDDQKNIVEKRLK